MSPESSLIIKIESETQNKKTALLFRSGKTAFAVNVINATILSLTNIALHVSVVATVAWWCTIIVLSSGRYLLMRRFHSVIRSAAESTAWRNRYIVATTLIAIAWGLGTISFTWGASDVVLLFTGLVLAGMVAGAVPVLAPVPVAFRIFSSVLVFPWVLVLLLQGMSMLHLALAALALVFLGAILVSAGYFDEVLETSIRRGLEQVYLAENLERARDDAAYALAKGRQTELLQRASEAYFLSLFENSPDPSWILRDNRIAECNPAAVREFGYPDKQAFISAHPSQFSPEAQPGGENSHAKAERMIALAIEQGFQRFEWVYARADHSTFYAEVTLAPILLDGVQYIYGVARDLTDYMEATQQLQIESVLRRKIIDSLPGIFVVYDQDLHPIMWNENVVDVLGLTSESFAKIQLGQHMVERDKPKVQHAVKQVLSGETVKLEGDVIVRGGEIRSYLFTGSSFKNDGRAQIIVHGIDITDRKRSESQIQHLAYHDQLTDLPNRILLLDRLELALAACKRANRYGAVMFVDLDQFKHINDVHGHGVGDVVLTEVAKRLRNVLRDGDTVARFGGDEFVILLPELATDHDNAAALALSVGEKVRLALDPPIRIKGQDYMTTASIGITLFPKQDDGVEDLTREADIAMYRAKDSGRNTLVFFEQDMQAVITEHYALEKELRAAISQGQLALYMQSQVDADKKIVGAETLVRWHHPQRGLMLPVSFIPLAEETGLIVPLGEWVLHEACRLIASLNAAGSDIRIAVNVSPRQFHQANFVSKVQEILVETGADPAYLTIEITENLLIERTADVVSRMLALSRLGIRFSIDDFGTGYSSLAYLKRLPLNELKIDKSFVQDVPHDSNDVALVETILSMAHHLGFDVVAEGVETQVQFDFLVARSCEHFQGHLIHQPVESTEWCAQFHKRLN